MEQQIAVALYHRDHFSRGHTRKALGYEAYHWGIIIMPKVSKGRDCQAFEATDASEIDPVTWRMGNPNMDWWLRVKTDIDPALSAKLLGRVVIGVTPAEVSNVELEQRLRQVPLPVKNTNPQQSCVTWVVDAIRALQRSMKVSEFDIDQFKDWALNYADERLKGQGPRGNIVTYTAAKKQN